MKSTTDYSIFQEFSSNREVDEKHVKRLMKSIGEKNLLHVNPIVVDKRLRVIDGQHRLEAAKRLGVEIFYLEDNIDRKDISMLNTNQKNWNTLDYINFYTVEGNTSFRQFSHMLNSYPDMSLSAMMVLCSSDGTRNIEELKHGFIDMDNIEGAKVICDLINRLHIKFEYRFVFDSKFPIAMMRVMKNEDFSEEILVKHIEVQQRSFVQCHSVKQYLDMILEFYNKGLSKNKITI